MRKSIMGLFVSILACVLGDPAKSDIYYTITRPDFDSLSDWQVARVLYPGDYTINIGITNDSLACSLRVGTQSSDPRYMNIAGPLAVLNTTRSDAWFMGYILSLNNEREFYQGRFFCKTKGKISILRPPVNAVPVVMNLTYGPSLKKINSFVIAPQVTIESISVLPNRKIYTRGDRVVFSANFNRTIIKNSKGFPNEVTPDIYFRVSKGKLCINQRELAANWVRAGTFGRPSSSIQVSGNLCQSGNFTIEFGLNPGARPMEKLMMNPRLKSAALTVR